MARIRSIKPETPKDRKLATVSRDARLTFLYMWTIADDDGLFRAEPRQLLGDLYPHDDDVTESRLEGWSTELLRIGSVRWRYTRDGSRVGEIVNWAKHQTIKNRSKSFLKNELLPLGSPPPDRPSVDSTESLRRPSVDPGGAESSSLESSSLESRSLDTTPRETDRSSLPIRRGRRVPDIITHLGEVLETVGADTRQRIAKDELRKVMVSLVFAYWAKRTGHEKTLLDPKRESRITARLRENGDDVHELLYAIDGYFNDRILRKAEEERNTKYDGVQTIFRDREIVERLAGNCREWHEGVPHRMAEKYLNPPESSREGVRSDDPLSSRPLTLLSSESVLSGQSRTIGGSGA